MLDVTRTFLAVALPEAVRERVELLADELSKEIEAARWVPVEQSHITLAFLGNVDNSRLQELFDSMDEVGRQFSSFSLELFGLGVFPSAANPRVLWVGVREPSTISELQRAVSRALLRLGILLKDEGFRPHATLARFKMPPRSLDLTRLIVKHRDWAAEPWQVAEIIAFASIHGPSGSIYRPLHRASLKISQAEP